MRVLLIGSHDARARLRAGAAASLDIAGEYPTIAAARASGLEFDALLVASEAWSDEGPAVEPLTAREVEVLELLAEGLSNKGIAGRLGISDQTVKFHVAAISGKLGAHNRTDAVRRAVRRGLVRL